MSTLADIPVPFTILRDPPPTIRGGPEGRSGYMHFLTQLRHEGAFIQALSGNTELISLPDGGTVERVVPLVHPGYPDMFAISYECVATGNGDDPFDYVYSDMFSHSRISVEFMTLPFVIGSDQPWYVLSIDSGVTIETMPDQAFFFPGGEELTGEAGLPIPLVNYNLTTYMSTTPITYAQSLLAGRVNSVPFSTIEMGNFPAGFMRYTGTKADYAKGAFGNSLVKSYGLSFRPIIWNAAMKKDGSWDIPITSGGYTKYLTGDLNILKY